MTKDGGSKALDHYFHRVTALGGGGPGGSPNRRKRS